MSSFALLPSPFLGPAVWQSVKDILVARGHSVVIPDVPETPPGTPEEVLSTFLEVVHGDEDTILVPHSNAGLYVPALITQCSVSAAVFVDAVLPPSNGVIPVAPPALLAMMRESVDANGLLPPWTKWWEEADIADLFPDEAVRQCVEQEQQRLPFSYLEGTISMPPGWDECLGAYLAFGGTYADDQAAADGRGWPVATLPGGHLHMLFDPDGVAEQILALTAEIEDTKV